MELLVKYHNPKCKIEKIDVGDWIDLRAASDVSMKAMDYTKISLGISIKLPEGYEAHISARSSTHIKFGIVLPNGIGIIDNSYSGNEDIWHFPAVALRDTFIPEGSRIAQFRIVEKQPNFIIREVDYLEGPNRGGFGSTGVD